MVLMMEAVNFYETSRCLKTTVTFILAAVGT
jgi:hypothetical protein